MLLILISGFLVSFILVYYIKFYRKWWNGPPGPFPIPLIGNLFQLIAKGASQPPLAISKISETYGDIFRLQVGVKDFVVLSSVDTMINILNRDEALGRDRAGVFYERSEGKNTGIITAGGKTWEANRKWTFKTLNSLGLRKGSGIVTAINEQSDFILNNWRAKFAPKTTQTSSIVILVCNSTFILAVTKVVFRLVMGDRINNSKNGAELEGLVEMSEKFAKKISFFAGIDTAFPLLSRMFPSFTSRDLNHKCTLAMRKAAMVLLDDTRRERNSNSNLHTKDNSTITSAYLEHMEKNSDNPAFSDFHYTTIYMDLLQASSETTSSYLQSLILYLISYPSCQDKIYEEISATIRDDEVTTLDHQKCLPYTEAFMLETHRKSQTLTNLVPHRVTKDFTYEGYHILRNTILIADMVSANNDVRIWTNPKDFNPSRFLDNNGQVRMDMKRKCVPFGIGRRMCPGEAVAEWTSFLFMVNILKNFKLSIVPGENPPKLEMNSGVTSAPFPFKISVSLRN